MKSLKEFIVNERLVQVSDYFDNKFVDNFTKEISDIYNYGADSDTDAAIYTLLTELIKRNADLKTGIVGACEDIIKENK